METEKGLELAKEEDFLDSETSQSRNLFCDQVLGATSGVSSLSENCSGSMSVAGESGGGKSNFSSLQNDPGKERVGNQEETLMCVSVVEENESRKGYSVANLENKIMVELKPHGDARDDDVGSRKLEVSAFESGEDIKAAEGMQKEHTEEANNAMQLNEVDSPGKIEVANEGISLIVEVFGPLNGINQDDEGNRNDKQVLREGDSDGENLCQINGTVFSSNREEGSGKISESNKLVLDVKGNSSIREKENGQNKVVADNFGSKENTFVVGALVWAITKKTQLWWPGVICDPVNAVAGPVDSDSKDSFLVKYFGSANLVWHSSSQLRHFLEDFDQLCQQNNSRNFRGAVERAISEIGERVKVEMTCPCFSRENNSSSFHLAGRTLQRYSWPENKIGASCGSSESQFHPSSFLASIKSLAQGACLPDKIKVTTTKSCLSAIYYSLGHHQLPIQQLTSNAFKASAHSVSNQSEKDEVMNKPSGANYCNDEIDAGKLGCTAEAKGELLTPSRSPKPAGDDVLTGKVDRRSGKCYESRERRKSKYLSYPFIDPKGTCENASTTGEKVSEHEVDLKSNSSQCNGKKLQKSVSRKSDCSDLLDKCRDISSSSAEIHSELLLAALDCSYVSGQKFTASVGSFVTGFRRFAFLSSQIANEHIGDPKEEGTTKSTSYGAEGSNGVNAVGHTPSNGMRKKRQKSKDSNGVDAVGSTPSNGMQKERKKSEDKTSAGTVPRKTSTDSEVTECLEVGSHTRKSETVPRKRKKAKIGLGLPEQNLATVLPDLNGNIPASSVEDNHEIESTAFCRVLEVGVESSCTKTAGLLDSGGSNIKFVQLLKDVQSMGPNFLNSMAQKSYMKGETAFTSEAIETATTSKVIDGQSEASGSNTQSGSLIKKMQPVSLGPKCEPKKRKRKVKTPNHSGTTVTSSIPDLNGNVADCVSPGNKAPDINSASRDGKFPRKRRRNKSTAAVADVNESHNKADDTVGVLAITPLLSMEGLNIPAMAASGSTPPLMLMNGLKTPSMAAPGSTPPLIPMDGLTIPSMAPPGSTPHAGDTPDILIMKKNLEMMTSMLEKAGNSLSPELKTKLETEIKGFMNKISTMVPSSSS